MFQERIGPFEQRIFKLDKALSGVLLDLFEIFFVLADCRTIKVEFDFRFGT